MPVDIMLAMRESAARLVALLMPGAGLAGIALLAGELGLDPAAGWGARRVGLLAAGVGLALAGGVYWRYTAEVLATASRLKAWVWTRLPASMSRRRLADGVRGWIGAYTRHLPVLILVIGMYAWFASSGTFTSWDSPTRYFADLARGFARGHLYLPTQEARYDYSIYEGRYYLYFGPVPATMLLLLRPILPGRLGDLQLTFAFVTGTFIVQCCLALMIWNRLSRGLPGYLLTISILVMGLASPTTFLLGNYIGGRVYEAAISGGQFFVMSGLLAAVVAHERRAPHWWLATAGISWALALGTRLNLLLPIGFMTLLIGVWILARQKNATRALGELAFLALPLALGLAALGWYNWARFGSVLETGYNYTTNTALAVGREFEDAFGSVFIVQNLWSYLLTPPDVGPTFPYLSSRRASAAPIFDWYSLPDLYSTQTLTGLVYTVPIILFAIVPLIRLLQRRTAGQEANAASERQDTRLLNRIGLLLSGAVLMISGVLLTYYWVAERFLADVMSALILLSVLGLWQGYDWIPKGTAWRKVYALLGILMAFATIVASTLIAISVNDARLAIIERLSAVP